MRGGTLFLHPALRRYRLPLFKRLQEELDVDFLWTGKAIPYVSSAPHEVAEIERLKASGEVTGRQAKELHYLPFSNFSFDLLTVFKRSYSTIVFSSCTSVPFVLLAPVVARFKKVILFEELWLYPKGSKKYDCLWYLVRIIVRTSVDRFVVTGSASKRFLTSEFGIPTDKIFTALNTAPGLDKKGPKSRISTEENAGNQEKESVLKILYLGRIVRYKGLDILIRSLPYIKTKLVLTVVGDGEFRPICEAIVAELNLEKQVRFVGACESNETAEYFEEADIFVLPTRRRHGQNVQVESWGFTVNEALSSNTPVISTTNVGAAFDLIHNGENGMIVSASPNAIALAITALVPKLDEMTANFKIRKRLELDANYDDAFVGFQTAIIND